MNSTSWVAASQESVMKRRGKQTQNSTVHPEEKNRCELLLNSKACIAPILHVLINLTNGFLRSAGECECHINIKLKASCLASLVMTTSWLQMTFTDAEDFRRIYDVKRFEHHILPGSSTTAQTKVFGQRATFRGPVTNRGGTCKYV